MFTLTRPALTRPALTRPDRAWNIIESIYAAQNFINYPWIYTAYILTQEDKQLLSDWCMIIKLHCPIVNRNLTVAELEKITHYWLGSKGIERFI